MAGADLRAVLVEGDVADVVVAILDGPVLAVRLEQRLGVGPLGATRSNEVDVLGALFARALVVAIALDASRLGEMREVEVIVEDGGGPDSAALDATVAAAPLLSAEGEKATSRWSPVLRRARVGSL